MNHAVGEITGWSDPTVHFARPIGHESPGFAAERFWQRIEEGLFALQKTDHLRSQPGSQPTGKAQEQRIGQKDRIGLRQPRHPCNHVLQLASLETLLTSQHRYRQLAHILGPGLSGFSSGPFQQPRRVHGPTHPCRRTPVPGHLLGQEDIDSSEEGRGSTHRRGFVQRHWQIQRHHHRVMTLPAQLRHQGIVSKTVAAIHAPGSRSNLDKVHVLQDS